jgi:aminoglycoside phosphotransferase (APT) family kinase protein
MSTETTPSSNEKYKNRLQSDFPDLVIQDLKTIGTGWDHTALEVNSSLIFRIPRGVYNTEKLSKTVAYETEVLKYLQGKLPVDIPNPTHIAPNNEYFGYPKLSGEKLIDVWPSCGDVEKAAVYEDWVDILISINKSMPVDLARKFGVPDFAIHLETQKEIFTLLDVSEEVRSFADKTIADAEAIDLSKQELVFIQNDLQFHNLLADPITKKITGVIDWTDACIGPVEREFSLWEWGHDNGLDEVAKRYERKTGNKVDLHLAKLFKHVEELGDYVEQVKSGEIEGANESLEHIRKWTKEAA